MFVSLGRRKTTTSPLLGTDEIILLLNIFGEKGIEYLESKKIK